MRPRAGGIRIREKSATSGCQIGASPSAGNDSAMRTDGRRGQRGIEHPAREPGRRASAGRDRSAPCVTPRPRTARSQGLEIAASGAPWRAAHGDLKVGSFGPRDRQGRARRSFKAGLHCVTAGHLFERLRSAKWGNQGGRPACTREREDALISAGCRVHLWRPPTGPCSARARRSRDGFDFQTTPVAGHVEAQQQGHVGSLIRPALGQLISTLDGSPPPHPLWSGVTSTGWWHRARGCRNHWRGERGSSLALLKGWSCSPSLRPHPRSRIVLSFALRIRCWVARAHGFTGPFAWCWLCSFSRAGKSPGLAPGAEGNHGACWLWWASRSLRAVAHATRCSPLPAPSAAARRDGRGDHRPPSPRSRAAQPAPVCVRRWLPGCERLTQLIQQQGKIWLLTPRRDRFRRRQSRKPATRRGLPVGGTAITVALMQRINA